MEFSLIVTKFIVRLLIETILLKNRGIKGLPSLMSIFEKEVFDMKN
jgi:hypothetical protein